MNSDANRFKPPVFNHPIIVIVGGYGSGKSEIAVNLARYLATSQADPVTIADLDIVNPYFRSREAARELEKHGIRSLIPPGEQSQADLPIIIPQIKGAVKDTDGYLILDVGGDDVGARVLHSLYDAFRKNSYELLLVLNASRPFTATLEGTLTMIKAIAESSGLAFTGIISNTHLMEHTSPDTVMSGIAMAKQVSEKTGLPVKLVCATRDVVDGLDADRIHLPLLPLDRSLLKPWERRTSAR
jgi:hypothetical protein